MGYIYKFTLIPTGKIYVGKRQRDEFDKTYWGSGLHWRRVLNIYGKENVKREVLEWCDDNEVLEEREKYWIASLDARNDEVGYNISEGGKNPVLSGKANGMYGKKHTKEALAKMHCHKVYDDEFREKRREYCLGKHWYNNGKEERFAEKCPKGFVKGRLLSNMKHVKMTEEARRKISNTLKQHYINNDIINGMQGKHHTEETKRKISAARRGEKFE